MIWEIAITIWTALYGLFVIWGLLNNIPRFLEGEEIIGFTGTWLDWGVFLIVIVGAIVIFGFGGGVELLLLPLWILMIVHETTLATLYTIQEYVQE